MNSLLFKHSKQLKQRSVWIAALIFTLGLAPSAGAQSHAGHDHAEEADHGESHAEHEGHDDHSAEKANNEHEGHDEHEGEEIVRVKPEVLREFNIVLGSVGSGVLHETVVLPGEIQFNLETLAYATPRYDGTVTSIDARLAQKVKKGQVLATLESSDTLRPFEVKAPFDGTVVAYKVTPGQTVNAGAALYTIANLDTVWADLRIYQRDLFRVKEGQDVRIVGGHDGLSFQSKIVYVAPTVDEHTRTGLARVIVDNSEGRWKPGQFIKGSISIDEHASDLLLPRSALLTYEGKQAVFIQTEEGFEPRPVKLGHSDAESFEVVAGLEQGDIIVLRNPISLKAELGKGSFGGHNH